MKMIEETMRSLKENDRISLYGYDIIKDEEV